MDWSKEPKVKDYDLTTVAGIIAWLEASEEFTRDHLRYASYEGGFSPVEVAELKGYRDGIGVTLSTIRRQNE
jgi:hypothetical protein